MNVKNLSKAMKLYFNAMKNPITMGIGLFLVIGLTIGIISEPEEFGSEDFISMITAIGSGNIGLFIMAAMGILKPYQNKVYASMPQAKELYVLAPVLWPLIFSVLYNIATVTTLFAASGLQGCAALILSNALSGFFFIIAIATFGKSKKIGWLSSFAIVMMAMIQPQLLKKTPEIFNVSLVTAIILAVLIYGVSSRICILIGSIWWKSGDKFNPTLKWTAK